ncbi:MAG: hypothetical protein HOA72_21440 [Desulfobacula sp.]|jgi:hypothetical protein|uniref:FecR family protein n=1 Tax=Desulfobacula sp. TaxID=2593537 RepID=UPI002A081A77|nr:hypothetical protein [Deltaproteobacteria bacterium]MBT4643862.1 hypothetical protein [Deltaproteobacteria bacterium]MBT6751488.1 hypothetical protein [Desulfobacula sp.]
MKYTAIIVLSLSVILGNAILSQAEALSVGIVRTVSNEGYILRNDTLIKAEINMKVMNGDVVKTGPAGSMGLIFDDDTIVSMGPDSEFLVEDFLFRPAENKLSFVIRILQGTYSFFSGQIAKLSPGSVRLETPDATIGMRGTHVLVQVKGGR